MKSFISMLLVITAVTGWFYKAPELWVWILAAVAFMSWLDAGDLT